MLSKLRCPLEWFWVIPRTISCTLIPLSLASPGCCRSDSTPPPAGTHILTEAPTMAVRHIMFCPRADKSRSLFTGLGLPVPAAGIGRSLFVTAVTSPLRRKAAASSPHALAAGTLIFTETPIMAVRHPSRRPPSGRQRLRSLRHFFPRRANGRQVLGPLRHPFHPTPLSDGEGRGLFATR
jgi:hypothetical protein